MRFALRLRPSGVSGAWLRPHLGITATVRAPFGGSSRAVATTQLATYLERCGATWGDAVDVHQVSHADDGRSFSWRVDLPKERLRSLQRGEPLESPPFELGQGKPRARFQLFPKGDDASAADGMCSLWLWTDSEAELGPLRLRVGEATDRDCGSSDFCTLEDALRGGADSLEVKLVMGEAEAKGPSQVQSAAANVQQSLHLTGLEHAEWQVFQISDLLARKQIHTSPPFRFHHVLLGDMYLEMLPGEPHEEHCMLFFRCRVPTMKLEVSLSVGDAFSKTFIALGRSSHEENMRQGNCLQVNLEAPGVLGADGSLKVRCSLEKVVSIPSSLRDMIPKLDERALWPKRL